MNCSCFEILHQVGFKALPSNIMVSKDKKEDLYVLYVGTSKQEDGSLKWIIGVGYDLKNDDKKWRWSFC